MSTPRKAGFALLAATLQGCSGPQNLMQAAGPAARQLASLGGFVLLLFSAVTILMTLLILWLAMRRRGSFRDPVQVRPDHAQRWILIGGFAIPAALLSIVFISSIQSIGKFPLDPGIEAPADIRLIGRQWWFEAQYPRPDGPGYVSSPTDIHIPVGEAVDIELVSRDVIHSFWVPKLHGKVDLVPGQSNFIRLRAEEAGIYEGQCGEFCGLQHAHMRVRVIAQPRPEYEAWLETQQSPAPAVVDAEAERGRRAFMQAACPLCHTIRGTEAQGGKGPDLTHIASRTRIAGGILENNTANLSAWITRAQDFKPGAKMPNITDFDGAELRAVVSYLQSLE